MKSLTRSCTDAAYQKDAEVIVASGGELALPLILNKISTRPIWTREQRLVRHKKLFCQVVINIATLCFVLLVIRVNLARRKSNCPKSERSCTSLSPLPRGNLILGQLFVLSQLI